MSGGIEKLRAEEIEAVRFARHEACADVLSEEHRWYRRYLRAHRLYQETLAELNAVRVVFDAYHADQQEEIVMAEQRGRREAAEAERDAVRDVLRRAREDLNELSGLLWAEGLHEVAAFGVDEWVRRLDAALADAPPAPPVGGGGG